jgi:hypothetical protein
MTRSDERGARRDAQRGQIDVPYWWDGDARERFWVEIRHVPGIGESVWTSTRDRAGRRNPWWDLVGSVRAGEVIYHYSKRERRFVGRSTASHDAIEDVDDGLYRVSLDDFEPIAGADLAHLRSNAAALYALRDQLQDEHRPEKLYLPFQFKEDRARFAPMSNYFARLPRVMVDVLFGADGLATHLIREAPYEPEPDLEGDVDVGAPHGGFLRPFAPADCEYLVEILGGRRRRTRRHEKLVNDCAQWLTELELSPGRNAAVDLGIEDPAIIIEAKIVGGRWATAIRQAVGQLYEYRYFKVAAPTCGLLFLASEPIPTRWQRYLEKDRNIGFMWPESGRYHLSTLAEKSFGS